MISFRASPPLDQKDLRFVDDGCSTSQAWNGVLELFDVVVTHSDFPNPSKRSPDAHTTSGVACSSGPHADRSTEHALIRTLHQGDQGVTTAQVVSLVHDAVASQEFEPPLLAIYPCRL